MKKICLIFFTLSMVLSAWDLDDIKDQIKDELSDKIEISFDKEDILEERIKKIIKREFPFSDVDIDVDDDEIDIEIEVKGDNDFINKEKIRKVKRKIRSIYKGKEINIDID